MKVTIPTTPHWRTSPAFLSQIHDPEFGRAKTYWREGPKGAPDAIDEHLNRDWTSKKSDPISCSPLQQNAELHPARYSAHGSKVWPWITM